MDYLSRQYKGRYGLYKGDFPRIEWGDPSLAYTIKMSEDKIPYFATSSTFQENTKYWQLRVTTDNNTGSGAFGISDTSLKLKFGTNSTSRSSLDNLVGALWGITGGNGTYSVDTPFLQNEGAIYKQTFTSILTPHNPVYHYFAWDMNPSSSTYMYVNVGNSDVSNSGSNKGLVGFVENNVSVSSVNFTNRNRFKFVWNKNTNLASIYADAGRTDNGQFSILVATHSFDAQYTGSVPFFFTGIDLGPSASIYNLDVDLSGLTTIVTNNHIGAATTSNYGRTSSPPPPQTLFGPTDKY